MILLYSPAENLTPEASSPIDIAAARELHGRSSGRGAMDVAWPSASEEPRRRAGSAGPAVGEERRSRGWERRPPPGQPRARSRSEGLATGRKHRRRTGRGRGAAKPRAGSDSCHWPVVSDEPRRKAGCAQGAAAPDQPWARSGEASPAVRVRLAGPSAVGEQQKAGGLGVPEQRYRGATTATVTATEQLWR